MSGKIKRDSKITDYFNIGPTQSIKANSDMNYFELDPYKSYKKKNIVKMVKSEYDSK